MTRQPAPAPAAAEALTDDALYASVGGLVAALSDEECIFQHADTGETHVMTMEVLAAMDACRHFRPMAEHATAVEQTIPGLAGKREAIVQVLGSLAGRGLMVSHRQLTERLRTSDRVARPAPVLAIRTCDRPSELTRLLDSIEAYEARFGRGLDYAVIDDSREGDHVRANQRAIAEKRAAGLTVTHLDRAWRARLAKWCEREAETDGQAEVLLGLDSGDRFTGGAAANAALLLTAGAPLLLLDDDFQLEARRRPGAGGGLGLGERTHVPMSFEPGIEALAATLEPFDGDPLAFHIEASGQPAGRLFGPDFGLSIDPDTWRGVDYDTARALLECTAIKTTTGGFWGDSPMDTTLWYYLLPGNYSRGLWADPDRYRALLNTPTLAYGFDQLQITRSSNFTPVSVDNTALVPCLPPTQRGEDYAFGAWMRYLYPNSLNAHMPWMLRHERPPRQGESPHAQAFQPWFSRFAGEYALSLLDHCQAERAEDRVAALVALYRDLAAASEPRRVRVLREFLAYLRAQIVRQLQQGLTSLENPPDYWLADAREWIAANGTALTETGPPRLRDWSPELDSAQCAAALADDLQRLATALERWPELWRRCRGRYAELLDL